MLTPEQRATWITTLEADRRNGKSESVSFERDNDYLCVQTARTSTALDLLRNESIPVLSVEICGEDIRLRIDPSHYRPGAMVRALAYREPREVTPEERVRLAAQLARGRESRAQNLSGDVKAYLDMADASGGSPADVGA